MNKPAITSLFAAILFAAIAAGLWLSRPADHRPHVAGLEQKLQQATAEIAKLKATLAKPKSISAFGPERSPSSSAGDASGGPTKKNDGPGEPSALAKMVSDPKMREAMRGAAVAQIEMQYAQLIGKLSLNDAETSHFKKLLSDRLSTKTDMSFKMMDAALSKEQRKAVTDEYNAKNKVSDAAIKQFLNDETDFATFKHWEDTEPERMQMMMGKSAFDGASVPLSPEQEEQLISLMAEVRKRPSDVPDLNDPQKIDPSMMTDEFTKRLAAAFDQQQRSVLEGAVGFLTPPQLESLKKMQEQMRTLNEAGLKMSKSMMGK